VLINLVGDYHNARQQVLEALFFLDGIPSPVVDLAQVVEEDHPKADAVKIVRALSFAHLEFRPVIQDELVELESLLNRFRSGHGFGRICSCRGPHARGLEMVRQCQIEQNREEKHRSHLLISSWHPNRSCEDVIIVVSRVYVDMAHGRSGESWFR